LFFERTAADAGGEVPLTARFTPVVSRLARHLLAARMSYLLEGQPCPSGCPLFPQLPPETFALRLSRLSFSYRAVFMNNFCPAVGFLRFGSQQVLNHPPNVHDRVPSPFPKRFESPDIFP